MRVDIWCLHRIFHPRVRAWQEHEAEGSATATGLSCGRNNTTATDSYPGFLERPTPLELQYILNIHNCVRISGSAFPTWSEMYRRSLSPRLFLVVCVQMFCSGDERSNPDPGHAHILILSHHDRPTIPFTGVFSETVVRGRGASVSTYQRGSLD